MTPDQVLRVAYPSEEAALRRAGQLARLGICTGCQGRDGVWWLLFDPDTVR